jgi:hypothetical protein
MTHWNRQPAAAPLRTTIAVAAGRPSLDPESSEVRELLEELDDAMFDAIPGNPTALKTAAMLWRRAVDELGWELVEESREQYLRYAVEITRQFEWSESHEPDKAVAAIEVIELLTRNCA